MARLSSRLPERRGHRMRLGGDDRLLPACRTLPDCPSPRQAPDRRPRGEMSKTSHPAPWACGTERRLKRILRARALRSCDQSAAGEPRAQGRCRLSRFPPICEAQARLRRRRPSGSRAASIVSAAMASAQSSSRSARASATAPSPVEQAVPLTRLKPSLRLQHQRREAERVKSLAHRSRAGPSAEPAFADQHQRDMGIVDEITGRALGWHIGNAVFTQEGLQQFARSPGARRNGRGRNWRSGLR